jgi:hypothetical protein
VPQKFVWVVVVESELSDRLWLQPSLGQAKQYFFAFSLSIEFLQTLSASRQQMVTTYFIKQNRVKF